MKIGVIGAGAIGTLFAASLAAEAAVHIFVRSGGTAPEVAARGELRIEGRAAERVTFVCEPAAMRDVEIVIIAVKAHDTVAALLPFRRLFGPATAFVSLQNGMTAREHIASTLGNVGGIALGPTTEAATLLGPGFVRHTGSGSTTVGWAAGHAGAFALQDFAALLRCCGLQATVAQPIEPHVWAKAIVNAAVNPLSALAGVTNGTLLERPELRVRLFAIAGEAAAVARAAGIVLPFDDASAHVAAVVRATAANRSSMLHDLERGRPTEIDAIGGAIVREARRLRVAVTETARVCDEVRERARA